MFTSSDATQLFLVCKLKLKSLIEWIINNKKIKNETKMINVALVMLKFKY